MSLQVVALLNQTIYYCYTKKIIYFCNTKNIWSHFKKRSNCILQMNCRTLWYENGSPSSTIFFPIATRKKMRVIEISKDNESEFSTGGFGNKHILAQSMNNEWHSRGERHSEECHCEPYIVERFTHIGFPPTPPPFPLSHFPRFFFLTFFAILVHTITKHVFQPIPRSSLNVIYILFLDHAFFSPLRLTNHNNCLLIISYTTHNIPFPL